MDNEGCAGCVQEAIRNRNQKTITEIAAKKYTDEKKINTVVYFDGQQYSFCEEAVAQKNGAANIVALFTA